MFQFSLHVTLVLSHFVLGRLNTVPIEHRARAPSARAWAWARSPDQYRPDNQPLAIGAIPGAIAIPYPTIPILRCPIACLRSSYAPQWGIWGMPLIRGLGATIGQGWAAEE